MDEDWKVGLCLPDRHERIDEAVFALRSLGESVTAVRVGGDLLGSSPSTTPSVPLIRLSGGPDAFSFLLGGHGQFTYVRQRAFARAWNGQNRVADYFHRKLALDPRCQKHSPTLPNSDPLLRFWTDVMFCIRILVSSSYQHSIDT